MPAWCRCQQVPLRSRCRCGRRAGRGAGRAMPPPASSLHLSLPPSSAARAAGTMGCCCRLLLALLLLLPAGEQWGRAWEGNTEGHGAARPCHARGAPRLCGKQPSRPWVPGEAGMRPARSHACPRVPTEARSGSIPGPREALGAAGERESAWRGSDPRAGTNASGEGAFSAELRAARRHRAVPGLGRRGSTQPFGDQTVRSGSAGPGTSPAERPPCARWQR